MLFSEIYGSYFNVVAAILSEASDGKLTDRRMTELVREKAFAESALTIPASLKSGTWPLLDQEYHSVLHHKPTMPLTTLQKRWLKALLSDPRIALFDPDTTGLEDVEPLYAQDTFILFDQYADGDPYRDPAYIACFQTALKAISEKRKLRIRFRGHTGARHSIECIPYRMEYSAKDDKFRLLATGKRRLNTINMARVRSCELLDAYDPKSITLPQENSEELVMLLHDERNGLERVLLHFSHFEKEIPYIRKDSRHAFVCLLSLYHFSFTRGFDFVFTPSQARCGSLRRRGRGASRHVPARRGRVAALLPAAALPPLRPAPTRLPPWSI